MIHIFIQRSKRWIDKVNQKKGISLIVLVITIIFMIILAATIVISLNNANVIDSANKAVKDTNKNSLQV